MPGASGGGCAAGEVVGHNEVDDVAVGCEIGEARTDTFFPAGAVSSGRTGSASGTKTGKVTCHHQSRRAARQVGPRRLRFCSGEDPLRICAGAGMSTRPANACVPPWAWSSPSRRHPDLKHRCFFFPSNKPAGCHEKPSLPSTRAIARYSHCLLSIFTRLIDQSSQRQEGSAFVSTRFDMPFASMAPRYP